MIRIQYGLLLSLLFAANILQAQSNAQVDSSYVNWYYNQRMELYNQLPVQKYDMVFLGNSITERGEWQELISGKVIANRGIGGDNTFGVLARLDNVIALQPKKIFLLIGINDLGRGLPMEVIFENYTQIIHRLKKALPKTRIYVQSILPLNDTLLKYDYLKNKNALVNQLNEKLQQLAVEEQLVYINLHEEFADENGALKQAWTLDGIHLKPVVYTYWVSYLQRKKYL
ncbi:GDSL-type esterase/lipase family protein [Rapidithrix thailandica]|uniref:GDSL-type esterase/lipase family protein n=1 Tax=Rapidithrix thailandica TaxID=413964 RepID=A0AAW9S2Z9_9BACT